MKEEIIHQDKKIYTVKDLMMVLNIGKDRAYALMKNRSFPSTRIGKTYFISADNFEHWLTASAGKHINL